MKWSTLTTAGKLLAAAIAVALLVAAFFAAKALFVGGLKTEAKLGRNQAEAAQQSGADAANVVGAAGDREAASNDLTRTNEAEIRNAEGADAAVAAPVRDAGLASLCRRASYKLDPKCVQRANPR